MNEILTLEEYIKTFTYMPAIIPENFIKILPDYNIPKLKIDALSDGKVVFIENTWVIISKNLPVSNK